MDVIATLRAEVEHQFDAVMQTQGYLTTWKPKPLRPRHKAMDLSAFPVEIRHMIYGHLFPEVAADSPYKIRIDRMWTWTRSGKGPPWRKSWRHDILRQYQVRRVGRYRYKLVRDAREEYQGLRNTRNNKILQRIEWTDRLRDISLTSRFLRVDVAQWLYPRCAWGFQYVPDAFKFFGQSELVRDHVKAISFECIDNNGYRQSFNRPWSDQDVPALVALLPNLAVLQLTMPVHWGGEADPVTKTGFKIPDLRVVKTILDNHPKLRRAIGFMLDSEQPYRAHRGITSKGTLQLLSDDTFPNRTCCDADVDVSGILRAFDAKVDARVRKRKATEEAKPKKPKRRESKNTECVEQHRPLTRSLTKGAFDAKVDAGVRKRKATEKAEAKKSKRRKPETSGCVEQHRPLTRSLTRLRNHASLASNS
ncbi:uncharacterized protein AB675_11867 [Cyphellophora attinorum]|uniref:Uncharacterized protein n=1 Tax=Cyphellophora attinorum TaxID=1664694 RepID=A0A0N1H6A8_9EURO|nr:uncharacterized protein AB675_11867 [Phialophora attinorum]KPI36817.1 hypothetical protein AB675_11867 [Phialophora attinorum]